MSNQDTNDPFADGSPGGLEDGREGDRRGVAERQRPDRPSGAERERRGGGQRERRGVADRERRGDAETGPDPSSRLLAVVVGGAVTFVVGIVPILGPMIGGGVAGYLRGSDTKEGALTGAFAGLAASIPATAMMMLFLFLAGVGGVVEGDPDVFLGIAIFVVLTVVSLAYMAFCAAIGGAIGAAVTPRRAPS